MKKLTILIGFTTLLLGCQNGHNGAPGTPGLDGTDGLSCTVTQTADGAIITCPDGSTAVIANGQPGPAPTVCHIIKTNGKYKKIKCD